MTVNYLKEAAFLEDVANELIQVHQTLVVPDMMSENRQHHGVLWRTEKNWQKGQVLEEKFRKGERNMKSVRRRIVPCFERKCDEEIVRKKGRGVDRGNREGEINQPVIIY